jgi:D-serine deaminase-like pyridoxal phosphate-dependent protein
MMTLTDLETPAAIVDVARLDHNIARMQARMDGLGVALRPHVKTTKCREIVARQLAAGARGITVSTLREAEEFFAAGIRDILYAVCIAPQKLPRIQRLRAQGCDLTVLVDSAEAARAVAAAGREGRPLDVLIEIDSDGHRSGLHPDDPRLVEIGRILVDGGAMLRGVLTHAGNSYELQEPEALRAMAEQERAQIVRAAEYLRAAGLPCPVVSIGSTPTAFAAASLAGVTEVRAGVYVLFDLFMRNVGVCTPDELALSVLTTVIGNQAEKGWIIVDAGWMAMSRDRGTARQRHDYGYGQACGLDGRPIAGLTMTGANQEHGILSFGDGVAGRDVQQQFPIGTRLRIWPNHACATGAQHERYYAVTEEGAAVWSRFNGW